PQLAAAYARFTAARDYILIVEFATLPPNICALVHDANCIPASDLESAPERALRATRLLLVVSANELLAAPSLERIAILLVQRPSNSVAVLLAGADKIPAEHLPALERRAWRTLVRNPPGDPSRLSLAEFGLWLALTALALNCTLKTGGQNPRRRNCWM